MILTGKCKVVTLLALLSVTGCNSLWSATPSEPVFKTASAARSSSIDEQKIKEELERFYKEWEGTPYRYGGDSKRGIDCSAFVQILMNDIFDKDLPRTTITQTNVGSKISKNSAKMGDLIFFKTGRNQRHVGLYLGDGRFMHASYSRGVMISSVDNVYWKKHFWHYRSYSDI